MDLCWSSFHEEKMLSLLWAEPSKSLCKGLKGCWFSTGPTWPSTCSHRAVPSSQQWPATASKPCSLSQGRTVLEHSHPDQGAAQHRGFMKGRHFQRRKRFAGDMGLGEWNCCPQFAGVVRRKDSRELECQFGRKLRRRMREKNAAWLPQLCSARCLCRTDANMYSRMNCILHFLAQKYRRGMPLSQPTCRIFYLSLLGNKGKPKNCISKFKKKSQENLVLCNLWNNRFCATFYMRK